jgi:hypothetical protein
MHMQAILQQLSGMLNKSLQLSSPILGKHLRHLGVHHVLVLVHDTCLATGTPPVYVHAHHYRRTLYVCTCKLSCSSSTSPETPWGL